MDPVYLAVFYHCVDGDGHVDSPLWVFVYTDPPDPTGANLTLTFDPALPKTATIVPYTKLEGYNTIYRIEGIPDKKFYCMRIKATDPTGGGRPSAYFASVLSRRRFSRKGMRAPTIQIINPPPPAPKLATMDPNFIAYGYVDPTTAVMSSWVKDSSNPVNEYSGVPVTPPPQGYDWGFSYSITTYTNPCTLYVQGVSDGTNTVSVQFNV